MPCLHLCVCICVYAYIKDASLNFFRWFGSISTESFQMMSLGLYTCWCSVLNHDFGLFWMIWDISWLKWVEDLETKGGRLKKSTCLNFKKLGDQDHQSKEPIMERCKDSATGLTAGSNQSAVCQCLELDRRHRLCACVRFLGRVRFLSLACTCIAHAACVLFAHVCQAITPGVAHTNPLRVPVGPPLPSVHGCINITCNTNDVRKPRCPHIHVTCTR